MTVPEAMKIVTEAIKTDPSYRETWKANIAMAFKDQAAEEFIQNESHKEQTHLLANKAADRFLDLLTAQ